MNLNTIIDELQEYRYINEDTISDEKCCLDDYQIEFLTGYVEVIFDSCLDRNLFEVYVNIKNTDKIADSLMYKMFYNQEKAKKYFDEVKKFIDENDEKNIINRCKIRD